MAEDQTDDRGASAVSPRLPRPFSRLLSGHAAKVERVRTAESDYYSVILAEPQPKKGKARRASDKKASEAFDALVEAVVELKNIRAAVLAQAESEGATPQAVRALEDAFESADREYAGYLAARTYGEVHEVARTRLVAGPQ